MAVITNPILVLEFSMGMPLAGIHHHLFVPSDFQSNANCLAVLYFTIPYLFLYFVWECHFCFTLL